MKRILLDIETNAIIASAWRIHEANIAWQQIQKDWYIICWTAIDLDTGDTYQDSVHLHKGRFKKDCRDDYCVVKSVAKLLDEADVVIAHNGDRFDLKKINARIIHHGFDAPSHYKSIDTLKVARGKFAFTSNRLDHLGDLLGVGRKIPTTWALWQGCAEGDISSHEQMLEYNLQDVMLLRDVFIKMLPWLPGHSLNMNGRTDCPEVCPACGGYDFLKWGLYHTKTNTYQRFRCKSCRVVVRARKPFKDKGKPTKVGI